MQGPAPSFDLYGLPGFCSKPSKLQSVLRRSCVPIPALTPANILQVAKSEPNNDF